MNLSYVTTGNLKISRRPYNPESGLIQLDLQITDKLWQPRLGLKNWNETSRTFAKVSSSIYWKKVKTIKNERKENINMAVILESF